MSSLRFIRSAVAVLAATAFAGSFLTSGGAGEPAALATLLGSTDPSDSDTTAGAAQKLISSEPLFATAASDPKAPSSAASSGAETLATNSGAALLRPVTVAHVAHGQHKSERPAEVTAVGRLAGDIQHHLKRLGCYSGSMTGEWDAATRAAMGDLVRAANARLSVKSADVSLLALAAAQQGTQCGAVVRAARKDGNAPAQTSARPAAMPGLMAVGGPRLETGSIGSSASPEPGASVAQDSPASADLGQPPAAAATTMPPVVRQRPRGEAAPRRHHSRRNSDAYFTHPLSRSPEIGP